MEKPDILIVDDSLTVRMDLRQIFEAAGFTVTVCENLATAREALRRCSFSLVILDVLLPDGDGVGFLGELKSEPEAVHAPVILLSSEVEVHDRVRGLKTGADDYVGKPYESNYLLARARELMGHAQQPRPPQPTVLLIDDSATFREYFRSQVESAGYTVYLAETGEDGLRAALAFHPDVIVVDRMLPGGLDGGTVIRRLKQDIGLRYVPCLLLTASEDPECELAALDGGADAFLTKNAEFNVLLARLSALRRAERLDMPARGTRSTLLGPKKILAVDDSITFLHTVSSVLHEEGYDVVPAQSGEEALQLLEAQTVDCILLDLRMPGMSGDQACRLIKTTPPWKNIPLILLTAVEDAAAMVEGINAGADDYVPKSTDFEVLKARVRAQLRRKQFEDEFRSVREELLKREVEAAQSRAAKEIAEARARLVDELERKNRDLEAFTYSVSHDLRSPLRAINGFTLSVLQASGAGLPEQAKKDLERVQAAANRMGQLIEALLSLSRSGLTELSRETLDLSAIARAVGEELRRADPERQVEFTVEDGLAAKADPCLLRVVLTNLIDNAWKYTRKTARARIEVGAQGNSRDPVCFVRDNGVGFDSSRADRLFRPFERMHAASEFPGAGVGLATVRRIVERHSGSVWAESSPGHGATFFFRLPAPSPARQ